MKALLWCACSLVGAPTVLAHDQLEELKDQATRIKAAEPIVFPSPMAPRTSRLPLRMERYHQWC
jgi:hypothetical protein